MSKKMIRKLTAAGFVLANVSLGLHGFSCLGSPYLFPW